MDKATVGLVGVGMMGWPMARCMMRAGVDLIVYDADRERGRDCAQDVGCRAADSLKEIGEWATMVITMLPNSQIVSDVLFGGEDALGPALRDGSTLIDMTSGVPEVTIALAERLKQQAVAMIDAPVSGGVPRAERGELTIMIGGEPATAEACRSVLETMGTTTYIGGIGAGQAVKALNNLVSAGGFLIGIEALLIGQKFGLDPEKIVDVLNSSSGMNNSTQKKFKQYVLSRNFQGGFAIGLMAKDVGIAMDIAKSTGTPAPFSALCAEMWSAASAMVGEKEDHTAITRMSEAFAKTTLATDEKAH